MIFPPGLILLFGALLLVVLKGKVRTGVALALPIAALVHSWVLISAEASATIPWMGGIGITDGALNLVPVLIHGPTPAFATIFCLMLLGGVIYAMNDERRIELPGAFVYAGGALCVTFAGDLITMFIFWEIMTLGSTLIIWSSREHGAGRAGLRYFIMHAVGGVVLMAGIILVWLQTGDLSFGSAFAMMQHDGWTALNALTFGPWLILIGMLVNAGAPPFSTWIPDAYPEASESGAVFLSAFTTKTAVFTLLIAFNGCSLLVWIGMAMAIYGIIYAIMENDMRRILAYSIVNQVGFMVCGIGIGGELATNGVTAHAFAHIIYKGLLLMSAGAVLHRTGKRKCTELGGLFRTMPVTMWCGIIGALAISSFPLTSGYTTKSMITAASSHGAVHLANMGEPHLYLIIAWFVLEAASAGVFLHAGIKFPWFVFFQKDSGLRPKDAPLNMKVAMIAFAFICLFLGVFPAPLYEILPFPHEALEFGAHNYDFEHVLVMLELLLFAGLAFFLLLPLLRRTDTISLDFDWIWRRALPWLWNHTAMPVLRGLGAASRHFNGGVIWLQREIAARTPFGHWLSSWQVSGTVAVIAILLLLLLLLDFARLF